MKKLEFVFGVLAVVFGFVFAVLCAYWYYVSRDVMVIPFGVITFLGSLQLGKELRKG